MKYEGKWGKINQIMDFTEESKDCDYYSRFRNICLSIALMVIVTYEFYRFI